MAQREQIGRGRDATQRPPSRHEPTSPDRPQASSLAMPACDAGRPSQSRERVSDDHLVVGRAAHGNVQLPSVAFLGVAKQKLGLRRYTLHRWRSSGSATPLDGVTAIA